MPKFLVRARRERLEQLRRARHERLEHDQAMSDPRVAAEHHAARRRLVLAGGEDCPFCD
jgi:hypothetical protein